MSDDVFCTFCGKHSDYVKIMIKGGPKNKADPKDSAYICDECIDLAREILYYEKMKGDDNV